MTIFHQRLQQILDHPKQFFPGQRSGCRMTHAVLLPIDSNLAILLEQQALGPADIELLWGSSAESHLAGFLFGLRRGFVKDKGSKILWKSNLGKSEGLQEEIGAAGKLEFLPDNGIERHVGPKTSDDRHVLGKFAIRDFYRFPLSLRL